MSGSMVLLEVEIPAEDILVEGLCLNLRGLLRTRFFGKPAAARIFAVELVAREALKNSVDYGCDRNPSRQIRFSARFEGPILHLVISDGGEGFNVDAVLARELKAIPEGFGNGLRIISAYTDRYEYRDGGRTLIAEFDLGEENSMQDSQTIGLWAPESDIVAANIQAAKEELRTLVAASAGEFVVDLSKVSMIDSKGLGIIIATVNSLEAVGRKMRVTGANADLVALFKMMRFDRHMTIA